jgi:hypothetical protein
MLRLAPDIGNIAVLPSNDQIFCSWLQGMKNNKAAVDLAL